MTSSAESKGVGQKKEVDLRPVIRACPKDAKEVVQFGNIVESAQRAAQGSREILLQVNANMISPVEFPRHASSYSLYVEDFGALSPLKISSLILTTQNDLIDYFKTKLNGLSGGSVYASVYQGEGLDRLFVVMVI